MAAPEACTSRCFVSVEEALSLKGCSLCMIMTLGGFMQASVHPACPLQGELQLLHLHGQAAAHN